MNAKTEKSKWLLAFSSVVALVPLMTLAFTAWSYVDEQSQKNRWQELELVKSGLSDYSDAAASIGRALAIGDQNAAGKHGIKQILAVRQLRETPHYCDTVIRVTSGIFCSLPEDQFGPGGNPKRNLAHELRITIDSACLACSDDRTVIQICSAFEIDDQTSICSAL